MVAIYGSHHMGTWGGRGGGRAWCIYIYISLYIYNSTIARVSAAAMKRPRLVMKTQLISNVTRPTWRISETPRGQSVTSRHVKNCPKTSRNHAKSMGERMAPQDQSSPFLWQIITCLPLRHSSPLPVFTLLPVRNQTPGPVCHTHCPLFKALICIFELLQRCMLW